MKHIFWLCALLMMMACTKESVEQVLSFDNTEFYAVLEGSESRTFLDERQRLRWHEEDCVTLFTKTTYNRTYMFTGKTGANAGGFKKVSKDDEFWYGVPMEYNYAVYPHSSEISLDETDCVLTVQMPEKQTYVENSFGKGDNTMVSISSDNQLLFKNVCSYLRVRLYGADTNVSSIALTSKGDQAISGEAKVTPVLDEVPTCEMTGTGKNIFLNCPTPVTIGADEATATDFWIVVPPVTLIDGFTVTVTNSDKNIQTFDVDKTFTFERNKYYTLTREVKISNDDDSGVDGDGDQDVEGDDEIIIPVSGTPYLTFTCTATQTLTMSQQTIGLQYSLNNGEWKELATETITFGAENGDLRLRGKNLYGTATDLYNYANIKFGNKNNPVSCTGDIRSLVDYEDHLAVNTEFAKFIYLFKDCSNLTSAPLLPATQLAASCYYGLFDGCSSLVSMPVLPATTLADYCYSYMFNNCTGLTDVLNVLPATNLAKECYQSMFYGCVALKDTPKLPATTLAESCYKSMFSGCQNLTEAPQLPATTLATNCYASMFSYCYNLTTVPDILPASILAAGCYQNMFNSCGKLVKAPQLPAETLAENCYKTMFSACVSLTTVPELSAVTLAKSCYAEMFSDCVKITSTPQLLASTLADNCYEKMFNGCSSLTTTSALPAVTLANNCYKRMFNGCINLQEAPALPAKTLTTGCYYEMFMKCNKLTVAPELPAKTLAMNCYYQMFNLCSSLKSITMLATDIKASNCLVKWVNGVYSLGTFTKAQSMESLPVGSSGIPSGWEVLNYGG